jgi:ribosomal protein S8
MDLLNIFNYIGLIRGYHVLFGNNIIMRKRDYKKYKKKNIEVILKMKSGYYIFENIKIISKPSNRVYVSIVTMNLLKKNLSGADIFIIRTKSGLKTDEQCLKENVGGEVLLKVSLVKL